MRFRTAVTSFFAAALVGAAAPMLVAAPVQAAACPLVGACPKPDTTLSLTVGTPAEVSTFLETSNRTATFTFDIVNPDKSDVVYQCKVSKDTVPSQFAPCTSPVTYPNLTDGNYTFAVQAIQNANSLLASKTAGDVEAFQWSVIPGQPGGAIGKPVTTLSNAPDLWRLDSWFSIDLLANEPTSRFICELDGKEQACGNGQWYSRENPPGDHVAKVWAVDLDGNQSDKPAIAKFNIPVSAEYLKQRSSGWKLRTGNTHMRHLYLTATKQGASITHGFKGARQVCLVVGKGPGNGVVKVYFKVGPPKTIKLSAPTNQGRVVVPLKTFKSKSGPGLVRVVVVSSGKPVIIEAIGVTKY